MNVAKILAVVCDYHGIAPKRVLAGTRGGLASTARRQIIVLAREFTCASLADIAEELNLQQFASVSGALKRHQQVLHTDPIYARDFRAMRAHITATEESR